MRRAQLEKSTIKKLTAVFMLFALILNSFVPLLQTPLSPSFAYAEGNSCLASSNTASNSQGKRVKHTPRVGGVALDMAAKFLADMTDVTGAYYDPTLDRIVFMGKKNTTAPQFDKDDMAVAIKAVIFRNEIPAVSIDKIPGTPADHPYRKVTYYGGIEDTKFGKILFDADYKLKQYSHGRDENNNPIVSSVPTYKSFIQRFIEYGPNPDISGSNSRFIIKPQIMTLKKDDAANSFVFDQAKMYVEVQNINPNNDPAWNHAANDYGNEMTANYDLYAQETSSWAQAKQLGKIVSVIKWIDDAGIGTDFNFARDYAPKFVATPRQINTFVTPISDTRTLYGEADYNTPNTYNPDSGTSSALKNSAQSVPTTKEDVHWTFTNNGQQYEAVAVTADAFRSLGSYNTSEVDVSFPTAGDLTLAFQRVYSSFSGGQYGVGRGWNIFPAALYDNMPGNPPVTFVCANGTYPKSLALVTQAGGFESFTINDCNVGYVSDDGAYNSQMFRNADGTFTARLTNQGEYNFTSNYKLTSVKDKNGNTIAYNYNADGRLTSIIDSKGHQISVNYGMFSGQTLISSISDWSGRTVNYTYDDQGNLLTVKDPNNNITTYGYDANFKLTTVTDRNNQPILTNTYTEEAKLATQKNAANITNTYTYDKVNRKITVANNQLPSRTQKTSYDSKARILQQTDPLLNNMTFTYGTEYAPLTIKDKNGNTITKTYDTSGNTISITYPDTKKVIYQYDTKNMLTKITDERYGLPGKDTTNTYDGIGNLTQTNEAGQITGYTYDATGEILTLTDPLTKKTTWTRDSFGNPLTEVDATTFTTTFVYDTIGRLTKKTDADAKVFSYTYDNNGNLLTQVDAIGTTTSVYDKENRLQKVTLPDTTVTEFTYNTSDALIAVKDPALNLSTYGYDVYQNLISQQDALNKITTNNYDALNRQTQSTTPLGKVSKWTYDANGNILSRIDANSKTTNYQYDAFNRLTKITYPDLKTVTFVYDNRGNRTQMIDLVGTSIYKYDAFDRLIEATNPYGNLIKYEYDSVDNLKKITYPDNSVVSYIYENNNRLVSVTDWNLKKTTYTYNKNGAIATRLLPNGIKTTYAYDAANRLISITHTKSTTTLAKFVYTRNKIGNITAVSESGTFIATTPQVTTFIYDVLGRITKAIYPGNKTFEYTYDKMGNRLTQKVNGTTTTTYAYDNDYRLTQKNNLTAYTYDNNGNQTKKPSGNFNPDPTYTFNFENRMTNHITQTGNAYTYTYDGLGNRLEKKFNTEVSRYVTDISGSLTRLLAKTSGYTNSVIEKFVYGLSPISEGDGSYFYLEDGLGNTRFLTSSSGSRTDYFYYDPFGSLSKSFGDAQFSFQEQQLDSESNLFFLRARYYDPELGRFISRDPVKGTLTNPQTQNPYAYALNNPINMSDPSGEIVDTIWDIANVAYDIATCDWTALGVDTVSAFIPFVPAGITKVGKAADKVQDALKITFGHGARHLEGTGLSQDVVEAAIKADIAKQGAVSSETFVKRFITIGGKQIEYHPYTLKDGTVNVGTYFLTK